MDGKTNQLRARILLLPMALLMLACGRASTEEVVVFAAASTTDALEEIAKEYRVESGNVVTFSFGGSSTLAKHIVAGAPADLFLSAALAHMDSLAKPRQVPKHGRRPLLSDQ